jgi:PadR family transcriptional regulator PadR
MLNNIKSQMRKGLLEYCILSIIHQNEAYASDILDQLKSANLVVVEGTVYPLLTRMKNEGLLSYRWQESTEGPPRKYYALTSDGETLLAQLDEEWRAICQSISHITNKQ